MRTSTGRSACTTSTRAGWSTPSTRSDILDEIGAFAADLSPDGSTFAVATASEVYRYDTDDPADPRPRTSRPAPATTSTGSSTPTTARCSPRATRDGNLVVWDARTGVLRHRFTETGASWGHRVLGRRPDPVQLGRRAVRSWDLTGRARALLRREGLRPRGVRRVEAGARRTHAGARAPRPAVVRRQPDRTRDRQDSQADARLRPCLVARLALAADLGRGGVLRLWDTATARLVGRRGFAEAGGDLLLAFSASSEQVYVSDVEEPACWSWTGRP